jgi:glycosyltransferase involved in cell wall biosynthesis
MISGAEAARITRALESVAEWTSEVIIVLNDDVQDGTEQVAGRLGAKVFREPWKGHVAQKNSAAAKANQPWLLGLDADEAISPELFEEFQQLFEQGRGAPPLPAYSFPRRTLFLGRWIRHGDWYPDRQTRLWQRGQARWGGVDPHDKLSVNGPIGKLRCDLLHQNVENLDHLVRKAIAYSDDFVRQYGPHQRRVSLVELWTRPAWRFFRAYLLRLGFLDGWQGYTIAWMTAFYTFLRYAKLREASQHPRP